ncbi:thioesterase [Paenibacillus sp. PK3_47]|uniref:thioesterase II family protein n=1 Tax=Paenibacillus sp. PK3_47 TaxID=2072642 RepID=UPI00201D933D|nr:alpha/beta fold hydrolase [Paenibacillus sp. PK3_47]UQZ35480.1 thioesterase [Paenibacillus sp. PK3_47]
MPESTGIKLFTLPCAGSSAAMLYRSWMGAIDSVEVIPLELPGRGRRFNEDLLSSIPQMVDDLERQIQAYLRPGEEYVLFGHSMGSLLAYELGLRLSVQQLYRLSHVFVSAMNPPHIRRAEPLHLKSEDELIEEIMVMGGTPESFFTENETRSLFLPIFYADFHAVETYTVNFPVRKLPCSITVLTGQQDVLTSSDMKEWERYTEVLMSCVFFQGGHFYLTDEEQAVHRLITDTLSRDRQLTNSDMTY